MSSGAAGLIRIGGNTSGEQAAIDKLAASINGFDEDYVQAGIGEDVDIEWRLRKEGHPLYYLKHLAIVYHLHHKVHYNDTIVKIGLEQLAIKKEIGIPFCANGIKNKKLLSFRSNCIYRKHF